uniref:Uncharacterized protein n=1 Tax=Mesocestoides corti TaxID=53468 RepID=A0A5K3FFC5_MESCO
MLSVAPILNSSLIHMDIYLKLPKHSGLDVSAFITHASKVQIHTHKPHTRHNDTNVVELG